MNRARVLSILGSWMLNLVPAYFARCESCSKSNQDMRSNLVVMIVIFGHFCHCCHCHCCYCHGCHCHCCQCHCCHCCRCSGSHLQKTQSNATIHDCFSFVVGYNNSYNNNGHNCCYVFVIVFCLLQKQ